MLTTTGTSSLPPVSRVVEYVTTTWVANIEYSGLSICWRSVDITLMSKRSVLPKASGSTFIASEFGLITR